MAQVYQTQSAPPSPSGRSRLRFQPVSTSFDDLDLPQTTTNHEPIFCCQICTDSIENADFDKFIKSRLGSPPFDGSPKSLSSICEHVIVLTPTLKNPAPNTPKKPVRYFGFIDNASEYQEIDSILYTYLHDTSSFEETTSKVRFTCPIHRQTYQLVRHDRSTETAQVPEPEERFYSPGAYPTQPLTEGKGASIPVITPFKVSYEKRKVMVRKLGYGRKDQVDEIVKSVLAQRNDNVRRCSWASDCEEQLEEEHRYEEEKKQEIIEQERLDFEIKHCLGLMRMFFLMGKKFVIA